MGSSHNMIFFQNLYIHLDLKRQKGTEASSKMSPCVWGSPRKVTLWVLKETTTIMFSLFYGEFVIWGHLRLRYLRLRLRYLRLFYRKKPVQDDVLFHITEGSGSSKYKRQQHYFGGIIYKWLLRDNYCGRSKRRETKASFWKFPTQIPDDPENTWKRQSRRFRMIQIQLLWQ